MWLPNLAVCPEIPEVAAVGRPDTRWGEIVMVCMSGAELDEAQVLQLFDNRLTRVKHPKHMIFCVALPNTALGKVPKAELLEAIAAITNQ